MIINIPRAPHTVKGFTLIELVIVVSIVGILSSIFFTRVLFYQEMAEKAAMQQVVNALQSGLVMQYGHRMARTMGGDLASIKNENPMSWLAQAPANYLGEVKVVQLEDIKPGNWVFEQQSRELFYVPSHTDYFIPAEEGKNWIRFQARFLNDYMPGKKNLKTQTVGGMVFAPVSPYQWLIPEN